jgi:hypothetical protein
MVCNHLKPVSIRASTFKPILESPTLVRNSHDLARSDQPQKVARTHYLVVKNSWYATTAAVIDSNFKPKKSKLWVNAW